MAPTPSPLRAALDPRSVAVIGASDNPHKVGGRPILYLQRHGFKGAIYPINPGRTSVQSLKSYPEIGVTPEAPELAIVAVAGDEALAAVEACAARGVKVAVVMTSGFGETGDAGLRKQSRMAQVAKEKGMRLIGPNCQGLANFATGLVANFSTIFNEVEAKDGPVAIVSQSGANSQAIYALLRDKGLGVRHVHATGNEADVSVADLAQAVVEDDGVRLLLLYMEAVKDPAALAAAARTARERGVPIVALKAARTASGQKAASSHTGALATEDRVIDAFLERHGIWRAEDTQGLVSAAELYLSGRRARGKRLVFISNSGASCVMAADHCERRAIPLARVPKERLAQVLPAFAGLDNPIDVTGALLSDSGLLGGVLPVVGDHCDLMLVALPVAGAGYDVARFAADVSAFQRRYDIPAAVAAPQASVRAPFTAAGVATFASEREAMDALAQVADHAALLEAPAPGTVSVKLKGEYGFLNEAESLARLAQAGVPVVEHRLCRDEASVQAAATALGDVVMKCCSTDLPHKSDHGLVALSPTDPVAEFRRQREKCLALGARFEGVVVARRAHGGRELALGARIDAAFGPLVLVGDGGIYLEALKDFRLLLPPFTPDEVIEKVSRLHVAPLMAAQRGRPASDLRAFAAMAVSLGEAMLEWDGEVASVDVNPVAVFETGAFALDALLETRRKL